MSNVVYLINEVRKLKNCLVLEPSGFPLLKKELPEDLKIFYENCGGIELFVDKNFAIKISSPVDFNLSNPTILGEFYDDISSDWAIVASDGRSQFISIDLHPTRIGRCYDSFVEIHGVAGSCSIVALNFTEFLKNTIDAQGDCLYWISQDFKSLGDAYDDI